MKAEHNSQLSVYKKPFGAATKNAEVRIRVSLLEAGIPAFVRLAVLFDGKTAYYDMYYVFDVANVCFYEAKIKMPDRAGLLHYWFELGIGNEVFYYGNNAERLGGLGETYNNVPENKYQITVYDKSFETPKWWRESVCYQIFPDRFYKKDGFLGERTDIIKRNWGETPFYKAEQFGGSYLANDFFGGNLAGIEEKLPYLKELGISSIYLNPVFKAYSNHRYDTADYTKIDDILGTEQDFTSLCKKAEKLGIRIILDGVFNHTGSDSVYFNKNGKYNSVGAYQSEDSPYFAWFNFYNYPDEYESWWGIDTLPQVREDSESYRDFILRDKNSVVKKWLKNGASGWRLDVVDELPDDFVKLLRHEVKKENPDAVIIGEVWEDASNKVAYDKLREYFYGFELDSVMNYPLKNALIEFALCKIDAAKFEKIIMSIKENYPKPAFYAALNFLSSHDTARILTVLGDKFDLSKDEKAAEKLEGEKRREALEKLKSLVTMQFMLPGVPTVFYGDEAGVEGYEDPFCRRCFPWGNEDNGLLEHYKKVIAIRNKYDVLKNGELKTVYKYRNGYGFIRLDDKDKIVVLANFDDGCNIRLDVARYGIFEMTTADGKKYASDNGIFYIDMPKNSSEIFIC